MVAESEMFAAARHIAQETHWSYGMDAARLHAHVTKNSQKVLRDSSE